jgi:type I protein arginine methyltransferase
VVKPVGYSLISYGDMIRDAARMKPYLQALSQAVHPGATVVDIGAGPGMFSFLACHFGAGHVHAIEPHPSIEVAQTIAVANGLQDRITFHRTLSTEVVLAESADVIISDLRGVLPLLQAHVSSIADARTRLLRPGGALIPRRDTLHVALCENADIYQGYADPWQHNRFGVDMTAGHQQVVNTWRKVNVSAASLLSDPQELATLDYRTIEHPHLDARVELRAVRPGTAHGLLMWFDAELAEDIGFSNAPGGPELIYGQAFFPLELPVLLDPGDRVAVRLRADLVEGDYLWRWDTTATSPAEPRSIKARFRQSTFQNVDLSPGSLRKRRDDFVPTLSADGHVDALILEAMGRQRPLRAIADDLTTRFPDRFPDPQEALDRVAKLSVRYSN